jgi:pimeloyl-ACP methyl ester carboxylesterase
VQIRTEGFGACDVHVRIAGSGPPLLLVHGFMTSSYSWRYAIEPLARRFTLYMPDLVGSGRSAKPDANYGPDALAESIGATIDALGIRGCKTIGNSLGGYLCMRLAMRDPGAMASLVNLHSPGLVTPRIDALDYAMWAVPRSYAVVKWLVWRDPERWVHKNVHYWDETLKSREEHREYAAPLRTEDGIKAFARMLSDTMTGTTMRAFEADLRALGGKFPIPLWLVYAEKDPMVPPSVGDRMHALLPDVPYVRLREGSHFAHVDATDAFLDAIADFLG